MYHRGQDILWHIEKAFWIKFPERYVYCLMKWPNKDSQNGHADKDSQSDYANRDSQNGHAYKDSQKY